MISPELKTWLLERLEDPSLDVTLMRSVHQDEPIVDKKGERWENHRVGSLYIIIRVGPEETHIENSIRAALGHNPTSFKKGS